MLRAILGFIKGSIVGGGVGYGLIALGVSNRPAAESDALAYLACALVGAIVGVVCGRAPWKSETIWTPVVKMVVGGIIGAGLCALARHFLPSVHLATAPQGADLRTTGGSVLAVAIGVLYGVFVEIDDGGKVDEKPEGKTKALST